MRRAIKGTGILTAVYLLVGLIWASTFGLEVIQVQVKSGKLPHDDHVIRVEHAQLLSAEQLFLCLKGRREEYDEGTSPIEEFSMTIPLADLWTQPGRLGNLGFTVYSDVLSRALHVPRANTASGCLPSLGEQIPVLPAPEPTSETRADWDPHRALLSSLKPPPGKRYAIYEVGPDHATTSAKYCEVVLVRDSKDLEGAAYYSLKVQSVLKSSRRPWYAMLRAFVTDALIFPYEMYLWNSGHS